MFCLSRSCWSSISPSSTVEEILEAIQQTRERARAPKLKRHPDRPFPSEEEGGGGGEPEEEEDIDVDNNNRDRHQQQQEEEEGGEEAHFSDSAEIFSEDLATIWS